MRHNTAMVQNEDLRLTRHLSTGCPWGSRAFVRRLDRRVGRRLTCGQSGWPKGGLLGTVIYFRCRFLRFVLSGLLGNEKHLPVLPLRSPSAVHVPGTLHHGRLSGLRALPATSSSL